MVSSEGSEEEVWFDITEFKEFVLKGRWEEVILAYRNYSYYHKIKINESRGTALHMAVNDGKVEIVNILVGEILRHEEKKQGNYESALRSTNERGNTPLHLAASRGFIGMCKCIIGEEGERKGLIWVRNKKGETPIFRAVLNGQTEAFVYLHHVSEGLDVTLRDYAGDTILHKSIWREFLELAIIINHCYPGLLNARNNDGATPLKVLACKPSAFKSGSNFTWWTQILYYVIPVKPLDAEKAIKSYMEEVKKELLDAEKAIKLYMGKVEKKDDHEHKVNIENEGKKAQIFVEQKYVTFVPSVQSIVRFALKCLRPSGWVVTALELKETKKIKQKHKWGGQLLTEFMKKPDLDMEITGGAPSMKFTREGNNFDQFFLTKEQMDMMDATSSGQSEQENIRTKFAAKNEEKETTFVSVAKAGIVNLVNELENKVPTALNDSTNPEKENLVVVAMKNIKYELGEQHVDKKETTFLTAVKNGIVEIVFKLQFVIPSVLHETNSNNENVLLVAVKNRQTKVIEKLKKNLDKKLFDNLILEVDDRENTVLHLASVTTTNNARTWQIAGAAMQMMWDIKWYEYVRALVPEHLTFRTNKDNKTAREVFKENHENLLQESSEWMKETSNSCSVVAALVAGVSFATSSSVPGGTNNGKPELEGQPTFDVFAIASLIGLCFSVTALIMFLAILTSRKQFHDFQTSLPFKLLFGLSSLFFSICSMLVSFCAGHFFVLKDKYKNILFPVYIATCLPVTFYAVLQFPLYVDLLRAIFKKVPQRSTSSSHI